MCVSFFAFSAYSLATIKNRKYKNVTDNIKDIYRDVRREKK